MYALAEAMEETPRESALQAGARPGAARGRGGQAHPVLHLSDAQELWGCRPQGQGLSLSMEQGLWRWDRRWLFGRVCRVGIRAGRDPHGGPTARWWTCRKEQVLMKLLNLSLEKALHGGLDVLSPRFQLCD